MSSEGLRIKVRAAEDGSLTVMFEPSGMTYELGPDEFMHATVVDPALSTFPFAAKWFIVLAGEHRLGGTGS